MERQYQCLRCGHDSRTHECEQIAHAKMVDLQRALDAEREKVAFLEKKNANLVEASNLVLKVKAEQDEQLAALQARATELERDNAAMKQLFDANPSALWAQLATLQAQLADRDAMILQMGEQAAVLAKENMAVKAQLRQVKGELANEKAAYEKLSEQWNKDSLDLQAKDAEIAAWKLELGRMRANHPEKGCYAALPKLRSQVGTLTNANARLRAALECMLYAQSPAWGYQGASNRAGAVQAAQQAIADTDPYSQARLKCGHASGQIARHCLVCGEVDQ